MDFDSLVNTGWADHDKKAAELADRLEEHAGLATTSEQARQFSQLANHTIGEHLGDWARAAQVVARVVTPLEAGPELTGATCALAVARYMSGDAPTAMATELAAAKMAGEGEALATLLRVRAMTASGLLGLERVEACLGVYEGAVALADQIPAASGVQRTFAIISNNLASALLERKDRTERESAAMLLAAKAARTHWLRIGTWINDARADYLLALVHNSLREHEVALTHAKRGLSTIAGNGDEPVDVAFLHLAAAGAHRGLGNEDEHATAIADAKKLAADFDESLVDWFEDELAKVS